MSVWRELGDLVAFGGWAYRNAHYLVAEMEIDARAAREWVPSPLRVPEPAVASLFTAWFPETSFGSVYREAGLLLHVTHFGTDAVFSPWMMVDDDVALVLGRELLGYPKKLGEISFSAEGDRAEAVASRRGSELVRMEGTLGAVLSDPPPMLGRPHRNVRTLLGVALPHLVGFTPRERNVETREARLEVTVGGSDRDPLRDLGFGAVRAARLHRVDLGARGVPLPVALVSPLWALEKMLLRVR